MKIYRPDITDLAQNLLPDASGNLAVGTAALAWGNGAFDDLQVNNTPTGPLAVANKAYVDAQISGENFWQRSTNEVSLENSGDIVVPNASGTEALGSVSLAWDAAYIDNLYLEADPTTPLQAATKQYVDVAVAGVTESDTLADVTGRGATTSTASTFSGGLTASDGTTALTVGAGAAGVDYRILFDGENSDGTITWKEDEDYFQFDDNVYFNAVWIGEGPSGGRIEFSAGVFVKGGRLWARDSDSASIGVDNIFKGSGSQINVNDSVYPAASGTLDLGSVALAYDDAHINKVYLEADPTVPLQAATKQYVDAQISGVDEHNELGNLNWAAAGHTIDADIDPTASGTINLGSVTLAYNDAHIDKVYLEGDPTTPFQAATKQYVDVQVVAASEGKVRIDAGATPDYIGAASGDGVLRVDSTFDYTDGGDFVTLGLDSTLKSNYDAAFTHVSSDGTDHTYINQDVRSSAGPTFAGLQTTGSITVNASGTLDIGTAALAFNDAHIDKVYLEGDPVTGLQATTKDYVDGLVLGLDWQASVLAILGAPPGGGESTGDRYIASATASGWTDNNIYQWNGSGWDETTADEGMAAWVENVDAVYVYNNVDWVQFGSTSTHNNLSGLQGGNGSDEYYHLTATNHGYIDQDVTSGAAPTFTADNLSDGGSNAIITTTQETNFEAAYTHVSSDGTDHTYINQDVRSSAGPTFAGITTSAAISPNASGTIDLGTLALAYDDAYIDKVYLEADPTTPLQAATKQYVDAQVAGVNEFTELTDTPGSYATFSASGVRVNSGETGLEFYDATAPRSGHIHDQSLASDTWVVTHNLSNADVIVQVTDGGSPEKVILPEDIELTDANTTTITFPTAVSGKVRIINLVLA